MLVALGCECGCNYGQSVQVANNMVKEFYLLELPVKDSCIVLIVAPNRPTAPRGSPDEAPTADIGLKYPLTLAKLTAPGPNRDIGSASVQRA